MFKSYRQDLPPEGGYKPLDFSRIPAKTYFRTRKLYLLVACVQFPALYIFGLQTRKQDRWETEMRNGHFAILPMLEAERDRAYLKVCRKNRDLETELMKDVPGWEVGTYYGDKIYWTRPADEWHHITTNEYFAHTLESDLWYHCNFYKFW